DVEKQAERQVKMQAAHDAQADEPGLFFLGQNLQRHAERVGALEKTSPVGGFAQGAGAHGAHGAGAIAIGGGAKIADRLERGLRRFRTQAAGVKYLAAETHRPALLDNDTVVLGMIDRGDLPAYRVAADVEHRKMIRHQTILDITERAQENAAWLRND